MNICRRVFINPSEEPVVIPGAQKQSTMMAIAVGCFAAVGGFIYGYDTGLINSISEMEYVRHHFASNHTTFSAKEISILTAILSLGTFFGSLLAPLLSDNYGRRTAIIVSTFLVFMVGNVFQVASTSLVLFCIGRFITGLSIGIISAVVPLYQAEASPKAVRGAIIVTYQWAITWGLLVSSAVSQGTHANTTSASYRVPVGLQFLWSLILGIGMVLLPESPRYFVRKDDLHKAALALSRLRRVPANDPGLIEELVEIKASFDYETSFGSFSLWDCFKSDPSRPHQLKRLLTGVALQAIQQCSSINFIFYYGVNFFTRTGVSKSYLISFVTYAVNVVCTIPGIFLVETMGRRKLLLAGGSIMSAANLTIAIVGVTTDSVIANKVMIGFVCLFIASFAASWGPVVWVVCGEIFSLSVRGKSVALTAATNWLVNFVFAYATPYLVDTGKHTAALGTKIFFMWSGFNILGTFVVYFTVYETKGLSLEQINDLYRSCPNAMVSSSFKVKKFKQEDTQNDQPEIQPTEEKRGSLTNSSSLPDSYVTDPEVSNSNPQGSSNQPQPQSQLFEPQNITSNEYENYNPNFSVDLGYGLGLASQLNRGPPSILSLSEDESTDDRRSEDDYSGLNDYVSRLSSMNANTTGSSHRESTIRGGSFGSSDVARSQIGSPSVLNEPIPDNVVETNENTNDDTNVNDPHINATSNSIYYQNIVPRTFNDDDSATSDSSSARSSLFEP